MEGYEPLWTTAEVAALFRVDPKTVRRWASIGKLAPVPSPGGRLLRFRESDVRALLASDDARPGSPPSCPTPAGPGPQQE